MIDQYERSRKTPSKDRYDRRTGMIWLAATLAGIVAVAGWVVADAAHARGQGCLHGAETRATFVGESHQHFVDRIGSDVTPLWQAPKVRDYLGCDSTHSHRGHVLRVRWDSLTPHRPHLSQVAHWSWLLCRHHQPCEVVSHSSRPQAKGHITRLYQTEGWSGPTERFPDLGNVFSDVVAMQTRFEADIWIHPKFGDVFNECGAHGGTILLEMSMWEYNSFLPDTHIGNDKIINGCNYQSKATWVDVNADQSIYIKGKTYATQCDNCSGGKFTYSWFGDPNDPWHHDSSEKR